MKLTSPKPEYIEKAKALSKEDAERIFSRMHGKLERNVNHYRIAPLEAVAMQLQREDEDLEEWRANVAKLRKKHEEKEKESKK